MKQDYLPNMNSANQFLYICNNQIAFFFIPYISAYLLANVQCHTVCLEHLQKIQVSSFYNIFRKFNQTKISYWSINLFRY